MAADNPLHLSSAPLLRMRPRSPTKSPSRNSRSPTRSRITDDIFEDLSPAKILERFTSASGELAASIEAASPDQRQFGIRAAVASKKIEEWANEVGGWPWPKIGADGFIAPEIQPGESSRGVRGRQNDRDIQRSDDTEEAGGEEEYWGSLPADLVRLYTCRISDIFDDMDDLDIEEIKNNVLDLVTKDARPSSSYREPTLPSLTGTIGFTNLDTFTGMITHTVLDALPKLNRLRSFLDIWTIRIDILRDVPETLATLCDAETVLQSLWESLEGSLSKSPLRASTSHDEELILTRSDYEIIKGALQRKVTAAATKIDSILDRLDGRQDTVPDAWLDRMDSIETEYGNWSVAAERKVLEGEWAQRAARETKEMKAKQQLAKQESLKIATVLDNGSEALIRQLNEPNLPSDDGVSLEGVRDHLPSVPVSPEPLNSPLNATRSPGNAALRFGPGLDDRQDERPLAATAPSSKSIEGGKSPLLIGVDHNDASTALPETRSRSTERPPPLRMSPSSSVERRSPLPRLPLPYQIYTGGSGPTSPEILLSSPRMPRSSPSTSLRPLLLNGGAPAMPGDSLPSSPNMSPLRSNRSSIALEEWNIVDTGDLEVGDSPSRDSQPSPRSPIFPSFRGSTLFPGSRSSSISLGPSPSKKRSESLFGNSEELALLAIVNDSTSQRANGPPVGVGPVVKNLASPSRPHKKQSESWESMKFRDVFSPSCQLPSGRNSEREIEPARSSKYIEDSQSELSTSASDPFMDETKAPSIPTRPTTSATPNTPPPMFASNLAHALMSPSNQPDNTCYYSDDDYPTSPTKKRNSPSRKPVLDDGGAPRSPKKIKKPLKERTWSESSASGEGDGSPRSPVHRPPPRPRRPVSLDPAPAFNLGNPLTSIEASRPASPVRTNVGLGLYEKQQASKTVERSRSRSPKAPTLAFNQEELSGSWESKPTHQTDTSNTAEVESIELDVPAFIAKEDNTNSVAEKTEAHTEAPDDTVDSPPVTSSVSGYFPSDTSPKFPEAEPAAYGKAVVSPVKARGNWPDFSGAESPARVSPSLNFDVNNILEASDEAKKSRTRDRQSPDNYQLDGAQSDRSTYYGEDEYANSSTDGYSDPPMLSITTVEELSPGANQVVISQRNSIVSVSSTDATGLTHSHAVSPSKLSVFNHTIAFESPRIVEDLVSDDDFNVESPTAAGRSSFYDSAEIRESIEKDFSAPNTPQFSPQMSSFTRESTDEIEPLFSELSENLKAESSALEAPSFSNVDVHLASPQGGPVKVSNDQLQQQISEILGSIPAKIELSMAPIPQQKPPAKLKQAIRKRPSHASLSPVPRPTTYSRAPTPSFTLAPAQPRTPRRRVQNNSDIQLYHLMHSTGKPPIKLFVRLVGEKGERVMVRVGGGWADLGEYLKEYASHHGRRAERDGEVNIEIPANNGRARLGSMSSLNPAPGLLMTGPNGNVWSSPVSRPGSSMGGRPTSSLQVRKRGVRKSEGVTTSESSFRSPSMPLPFTSKSAKTSTTGDDLQTPPARSVSRQAWSVGRDGEEVHLGPAGPKKNKGDLDEGRKRWVDNVVDRIRQVSVEKTKGALVNSGGTKRLFRKKET